MTERLRFGTAGLRAPLGDGPDRMNVQTVELAATALAQWLAPGSEVVVGYDARHGSLDFANVTSRVLADAGHLPRQFDAPVPTPIVVFAVAMSDAAAGVVVTASHNPATDNGYKVYAADGSQILPDTAAIIEANMDALPWPGTVSVDRGDGVTRLAAEEVSAEYLAYTGRSAAPKPLTIAYTALHGVGGAVATDALGFVGHEVISVPEQHEPDPNFPTAPFPNPEEPGTLDLAIALADDRQASLVLANDPDADRLAVAVQRGSQWERRTGDQIGALLGWYLIDRSEGPRSVATTIVSSSLLDKIASAAGVGCHKTLTGFKWLMQTRSAEAPLIFAYEEALGYSVLPWIPDKDGISAAVVFAELASMLGAVGMTVDEQLDEIYAEHGYHLTSQVSVRFEGGESIVQMSALMAELRANPPAAIGGVAVVTVDDLLDGGKLPPSNVLRFMVEGGRVIIRPSGTEPKIKAYIEAVDSERSVAQARLDQLKAGIESLLASAD